MDTDRARTAAASGSLLKKAAVIYCVLGCFGIGVIASFVPGVFEGGELSPLQLLVVLVVGLFTIGPVVAAAYIALSIVIEGAVHGVGLALELGFHAVVRSVRRVFRGED